jgi:hypothetical protein
VVSPREVFRPNLSDRKLLTAKLDASARSREPPQANKGWRRERRGGERGLEFKVPGDRLGKAGLGDPEHNRHRRIARPSAERDLQIQGIDVGQGNEAMGGPKIAEIERRISARIPGKQIEMLLSCPFDDCAIGVELDDDELFPERNEQVDNPGADATGAADHNVPTAAHRTQPLQGDPVHPRQKGSAESDKKARQSNAGQHQQHRGNDFEWLAAVGGHVAVSGRRHCRHNKVDGVEPGPSKDSVKIPRPDEEHDQGDPSEPG